MPLSPTEAPTADMTVQLSLGGEGGRAMGGRELIGHQTNMNNSRFEEMILVYSSDEMCPTFDVFFFPRAIDSIYRSRKWRLGEKEEEEI